MPALTDPALYADGREHEVWAALRREAPVAWQQHDDVGSFWAVTSYEAGHRVLTDWESFTSANGTVLRADMSTPYPGAGQMLALTDPPRHDVLRKAIWPLFTPRAVSGLEGRARTVVGALLEEAVSAGGCDFVEQVASRMILPIAADVLGIAAGDMERIASLLEATVDNITDVDGSANQQAHLDLLMYYAALVDGGSPPGRRDLVSTLTAARAGGLDVSDEEIVLACDNVVVGAAETTKQAASVGLLALVDHPSAWRALRDGSVALNRAVEEILRWASPALHVLRTAQVDTTLAGSEVRAGDPVAVWIPSLNRDELVFPDGGSFQLDRDPNRHLTFGAGVHFCVGAALSRLVLRVMLEELVRTTRAVGLAGVPTRLASFVTGGLAALPVTLESR